MAEFSYSLKFIGPDDLPGALGLQAPPRPMQADGRRMSVRALLSSETRRDRQGDCLVLAGLDLSSHEQNAVVLYDHGRNHQFPIAVDRTPEGVYTVEADLDAGELWHTAYFSQRSAVAEQVFALIEEGMLSGCSVGFRPKEWEPLPPDEEEGYRATKDGPAGKLILRAELVECSFCSIPVCADAARVIVGKSWAGRALAPALLAGFKIWLPESRSLPVRGGWDGLAAKAWSYAEKTPGPPPRPGLVFDESSRRWTRPDSGEPKAGREAAPVREAARAEPVAEAPPASASVPPHVRMRSAGEALSSALPAMQSALQDAPTDDDSWEAMASALRDIGDHADRIEEALLAEAEEAGLDPDRDDLWEKAKGGDTLAACLLAVGKLREAERLAGVVEEAYLAWREARRSGEGDAALDAAENSLQDAEAASLALEQAEAALAAYEAEQDALEGDAPSGSKAWAFADDAAEVREAAWLAAKAWAYGPDGEAWLCEKARALRAEGAVWTVGSNRYTKIGGKIRRAPAGGKDSPKQTEGEYRQWQEGQRQRHQGPPRPKGDPAKAREAVQAHLAKGDAATSQDIHELANTLRGLTREQIREIKGEQGVKASGNKWEFAQKVAERLIAAIRKEQPKEQPAAEAEPDAKPAAADDPAVQAAFGDAYRDLSARGVVEIPDLVDAMRKAAPDASPEDIKAALQQWQREDKLTLQIANDRDLAARAADGIETPNGLAYYVQAREAAPEDAPAAEAAPAPPEPGFTGEDAQGRMWQDGELVAAEDVIGLDKTERVEDDEESVLDLSQAERVEDDEPAAPAKPAATAPAPKAETADAIKQALNGRGRRLKAVGSELAQLSRGGMGDDEQQAKRQALYDEQDRLRQENKRDLYNLERIEAGLPLSGQPVAPGEIPAPAPASPKAATQPPAARTPASWSSGVPYDADKKPIITDGEVASLAAKRAASLGGTVASLIYNAKTSPGRADDFMRQAASVQQEREDIADALRSAGHAAPDVPQSDDLKAYRDSKAAPESSAPAKPASPFRVAKRGRRPKPPPEAPVEPLGAVDLDDTVHASPARPAQADLPARTGEDEQTVSPRRPELVPKGAATDQGRRSLLAALAASDGIDSVGALREATGNAEDFDAALAELVESGLLQPSRDADEAEYGSPTDPRIGRTRDGVMVTTLALTDAGRKALAAAPPKPAPKAKPRRLVVSDEQRAEAARNKAEADAEGERAAKKEDAERRPDDPMARVLKNAGLQERDVKAKGLTGAAGKALPLAMQAVQAKADGDAGLAERLAGAYLKAASVHGNGTADAVRHAVLAEMGRTNLPNGAPNHPADIERRTKAAEEFLRLVDEPAAPPAAPGPAKPKGQGGAKPAAKSLDADASWLAKKAWSFAEDIR